MTMTKARISADNVDMAGVSSVMVFGHMLTRDYAEIEVSDEVLAKLKGNPTIEVLVRKPSVSGGHLTAVPAATPPQPAAPQAPAPTVPAVEAPKG